MPETPFTQMIREVRNRERLAMPIVYMDPEAYERLIARPPYVTFAKAEDRKRLFADHSGGRRIDR